jgi:alginate O-acetyltransferase complex protein AlgI
MLFCSREYLFFFIAVFTVYWAMKNQWARLVTLVVVGGALAYFGHWSEWPAAFQAAPAAEEWIAGISPLLHIVSNVLATPHKEDWMAGILLVSMIIAQCQGGDRGRVWLLMMSSFFFYACFNKWLALIICVSTAMDYFIARGLAASESTYVRRSLLTLSIVANLGLLVLFKYYNFFLDSVQAATRAIGYDPGWQAIQVILPIGISFYTFEAINYTVDVYRKRTPAEKNLANFMLFITFFPHLVAGPIVRAKDFLPQIHRTKHFDWPRMQLGVQYFLLGLFKKLAIADRMGQYFADPVFANPEQFGTATVWIAVIAYALQIYCDFSGYTDMALGSAHMLGYKLAINFNMPYLSRNLSEFWRRWHISLSSWLRDYLFIPLGGSRGTNWQTCRNLMITMALGGLWHGASWTFVVWGVLHGVYLIIHRQFQAFCKTRPRFDQVLNTVPGSACRLALTLVCVLVGWVFFRAQTFGAAATILDKMFVLSKLGRKLDLANHSLWWTVVVVALCHFIVHYGWWKKLAARLPAPVLGFGYAAMLTLAMLLAPAEGKQFIYFQF